MPLVARGTGRPDFSSSVEASVIPIVRSWQDPAYVMLVISVPANSSVETEIDLRGKTHYIYDVYLSAMANILIRLELISEGIVVHDKKDYQAVDTVISAGWPADQLTVRVTNYSDMDMDFDYCHHGLISTEKITPVVP
ncbi:MAG: hypothetical protein QMC85_06570 [Methanocellales archaeon]|nr:hypothetical protein [Methanocellales archaeon]